MKTTSSTKKVDFPKSFYLPMCKRVLPENLIVLNAVAIRTVVWKS